jgi:hypothetical protein
MKRRAALLAALACAIPSVATAQNAVTGVSLRTHATFTNVGVDVTIAGDDDGDATAALEVAVGSGDFKPAHRLSRAKPARFVGSAFFLPPGTSYQVRVTLADPDGVTSAVLTGSGKTRVRDVPVSSGQTWHVTPGGSDTAAGSAAAPFATVARGLSAAQPGDTVLLHAGTYHEEVQLPRGGSEGKPITLAAAGDGAAVLDGAEPDLKNSAAWTDEGGGVWSASVAATRYVSVDGTRLWRYETLADLRSLALGTDGGFFFDGAKVLVRLPGGAAPSGHEIQASTLGRALWLEGTPDVVIRGLTIRCYGSEEYAEGIMVRDGSHRVFIVGNTFENVMPGIWVKNDVDDLTVRGNTFSDKGLAEFGWQDIKDQGGMESGAIALDNAYDGQGIVFEENAVHDSFDGLHLCGDDPMDHPNDADVLNNTFEHLGDDGMETDGECSNIRIIGNRWRDSLTAVSVAPAVTGPTYVMRNLATHLANVAKGSEWMTRFMKFNVGDDRPSGEVFAYHNTAVIYEAAQSAFTITDDSLWTRVEVKNNIWVGTDYALYYQNQGDEPFEEDYDLLYSTGSRLVRWQGSNYTTLADFTAATGQCAHGVSAAPAFVDEPAEDYRLEGGSPAVDRGVILPGINDGFAGTAPDLGAFELGAELPPWPDGGTGGGGTGGSGHGGSGEGGGGSAGAKGGCGCVVAGVTAEALPAPLASALIGLALLGRRRRRSGATRGR